MIDPGHGGPEIGASHTFPDGTVLAEKDVNLTVATRIVAILRQAGYRVTLTRTTDSWVDASRRDVTGDGKVDLAGDLQARIDRANETNATLFLSIHFNGYDDPGLSGTTGYYDAARPFAQRSLYFARLVDQEAMVALGQVGYSTIDRGVQTDSTAVGQGSYF